ncbi:PREDICTED: carboxylesterase 4A-like isoform X2 [Nicrophorus vespilloides]|uniref:Carboxylesterase 4A-like isoform X2 n=1 Tax=Nicrophorus vespilloides TaxID=110193 RepID=A0ABM1M6F7_NICVS|nr:PREDICTED: carboxylesterase 4A-like isoform X2 [Nicrophorus vespilloides]
MSGSLRLLIIIVAIYMPLIESNPRVKRIVGGSPAQLPPPDDPRVFLRFAAKSAYIKGVLDTPHYVFRGIRYAHKPNGKDRFQRPRQYFLEGDIDATKYPPACLQNIPGDSRIIGNEDCLFLNVFTPNLPDGTEGYPVIIWIHGGGFRHGSASQYGMRNLVGQKLVLVAIQYRLGTLGFLSTATPELPGNAALWDMAVAVQWVRNYIGFFGGNPHRIAVMGQGTGASSALMLALTTIAQGSVSAVVAMSGTAVSHWALENSPALTAEELAQYHGCPTSSILVMLKCMQNLPPDSIIEGDYQLERTRLNSRGFVSGMNGLLGSAPNAEGRFDGRSLPAAIEYPPMDEMTNGNIPNIPLLTGVTRDETKRAVNGKYREEIVKKLHNIPNFLDYVLIKNLQNFTTIANNSLLGGFFNILEPLKFRNYVQIEKNNVLEGLSKISQATVDALFNLPAFLTADLWSKKTSKTYLYSFEHVGKARKGRDFLKGLSLIGYIFEARNLDGTPLNDKPEDLSVEDMEVRERYTAMIAEFVKTGEITINNKRVPSFSQDNSFIQISTKPKITKNFRFCEMGLWAGLAQRLQSKTCQFLNVIDSSIKNVENLFFDTVNSSNINKLVPTIDNTHKKIGGIVNKIDILNIGRRQQQTTNNMIPPLGFLG